MKALIKGFFNKFGYELRKRPAEELNPFKNYDCGAEAYNALQVNKEYSMMPHVNLVTLYEQAVYCEKFNIPGDFVECGVWKGGAVGMMAMANLNHGIERRTLHLFDAFTDICEPNPEIDGEKAMSDVKRLADVDAADVKGEVKPIVGFYDSMGGFGTIDICNELLVDKIGYDPKYIRYHKGWFQDTIKTSSESIDQIAILRLDGDWYESIKVCLDHLYDKVVSGGMIVIDDYGYYDGCTKAVDEFLEERNIKTFLSYSNYGCRYFVKP